MLSCVRFFATPWTVALEGSPWDFPGKNLPFPPPGDLCNPGMELKFSVFCIGRWILYHCNTWVEVSDIAIIQQIR